jgi:hypothetical protein
MRVWIMASVGLLGGCAQGIWVRPGATQSDFAQEQAECQLTAELGSPDHHTNTAYMKPGAALAAGLLDGVGNALRQKRVMDLCMTAHGWSFMQQPAAPVMAPVQSVLAPLPQSPVQPPAAPVMAPVQSVLAPLPQSPVQQPAALAMASVQSVRAPLPQSPVQTEATRSVSKDAFTVTGVPAAGVLPDPVAAHAASY